MSFAAMCPFVQQPRLLLNSAGVAKAGTMTAVVGGSQIEATITFGPTGTIAYFNSVGDPPFNWSLDSRADMGAQCEVQATVVIESRSAIQSDAEFFGELITSAVGVPYDTAWYGLESSRIAKAYVAIPFGGHFIYTTGTFRIRLKGLPETQISRSFILESG